LGHTVVYRKTILLYLLFSYFQLHIIALVFIFFGNELYGFVKKIFALSLPVIRM